MPEESHPLIVPHKLWCHLLSLLWTTNCLLDPLCASLNIITDTLSARSSCCKGKRSIGVEGSPWHSL